MTEVRFELNDTLFVWDADKERANIRAHDGIDFARAATVFFDPFLRFADASRNNEVRDAVIGFDDQAVMLFVVHALMSGESIRIISARKATRTERDTYDS